MVRKEGDNTEELDGIEGVGRSYWFRFYLLLSISVIIATLGLYRNSVAVVIAAMLIAPLMAPILGIATTIVRGLTARLLWLLLTVTIASVVTIVLAYVILLVIDVPRSIVIPAEVIARTDPGLEELLVALAAGIAGAYVQLRKEEAGLVPGVAIGVSLVPPLAAAGILLYFHDPELAWEAVLLYLTNLAAIVLSACAVFLALGIRPPRRDKAVVTRAGLGTGITLAVVVVLALELGAVTIQRFREALEEELVLTAITNWSEGYAVEIVRTDVSKNNAEIWLIFDTDISKTDELIAHGQLLSPKLRKRDLKTELQRILGREIKIYYRAQIRYSGEW